jgi:hypothetical protein
MEKYYLWLFSALMCLNASGQDLPLLAGKPPRGWNSWNCFGMDVTDKQLMATAGYMAENLKNSGWEYVVLDMGWYYAEGLNTNNFRMRKPPQYIDEYGRLIPSLLKFPSAAKGKGLKPVGDYIHSLGLKFGIHIMRGIPWQAVEQNTPIKGTTYRAGDIASFADSCRWYHGMVGIDMTKPGAQEYYNSLLELYKEWGVDYIKADDMLSPYRKGEIEGVSRAIKTTGRPIVLSLSAGPIKTENAEHLQQNANMWRITGDMWDHWSYIIKTFEACRMWQDFVLPDHWPDCDMLPFGKLRINGTDGALANKLKIKNEATINEYDRLTKDEKYSLMTLWVIFRSPLMMGGNLLELDEVVSKLLTNAEVLAINQGSKNNHELRATDREIIWAADGEERGVKYVACFNIADDQPLKMRVSWKELGISGRCRVRGLWNSSDSGYSKKYLETSVEPHGCRLFKISQSE